MKFLNIHRIIHVNFILLLLPLFLIAFPANPEINGLFELGTVIEYNWFKANIELETVNNIWILQNELYGGVETWFLINGIYGSPFKAVYTIGDRISFKILYLEVEHSCGHPIMSDGDLSYHYTRPEIMGGTLTTISVGVKW